MDWSKYVMPKGCYKGKTLEVIYNCDVNHLIWARDDHPDLNIRNAVAKFMAEENRKIIQRSKETNRR